VTTHRKLAAILSADAAGYSRLMADDEAATLRLLNDARSLFRERIQAHGGRLIDTAGDSILAEFPSAVEAVDCAVEIQHELAKRNSQLAEHRRMQFRIGVNLGDVIEQEDGTIYGDGVNVTARLQELADPGSLCISGTVFDQVEGKLPLQFKFIGEQQVKNIAKPVRAFRSTDRVASPDSAMRSQRFGWKSGRILAVISLVVIVLAGGWLGFSHMWAGSKPVPNALDLPKGPSIAVLPFNNLSGNKDDDYFSDGISEDIITALSRFNDLFVIARNSSFQFKSKAVDVREVGKNLGVQYVLEGSVRRDKSRLRVTAQLLDARNGAHLWAENYDRDLTANSIFAIQDELASKVVSKIGDPLRGMISQAGMSEASRKGNVALSAYECVLRAKAYFATFDPAFHKISRECLEEAVKTDPSYSDAWAWLALVYTDEYSFHYDPRPNSLARAVDVARRSITLDPSNQMGNWFLARALFFQGNFDQFLRQAERAVGLNPNNTAVLAGAAVYISYSGQWERGKELIERALALNPNPPWWYYAPPFFYHFRSGDDQQALTAALKMRAAAPGIYWSQVTATAAYAQLGRLEEAKSSAAELVRLVPSYASQAREDFRKYNLSPQLTARMIDGLRKAGFNIPDEPK
jgi:adenylate cyclase